MSGIQHIPIRSSHLFRAQSTVIDHKFIQDTAKHMEAEYLCQQAAVIIFADEQIRVRRLGQAGSARQSRGSDLLAVQVKLHLSLIPIEDSIHVRPFILR
ncbi:hypothetical protein D3C77_614410 [compost metagenome]